MIIRIRISVVHLMCFSMCANTVFSKTKCIKEEKEALLNFKYGLEDTSVRLSSWNDKEEDCCKWIGVRCSDRSGHVVRLALPAQIPSQMYKVPQLRGNISSSLLVLREINYLDLSYNDFTTFPKFLGSLSNLDHLNLFNSFPRFDVEVPDELGNLTKLQYLNLGGSFRVKFERIEWFSNLRSLKHLDLSLMNLSGLTIWGDGIDMIPSLEKLYIRNSLLPTVTKTVTSNRPINYSNSLAIVDLAYNHLSSSVYLWLSKYKSLRKLDLSYNEFGGSLPDFTKTFVYLTELSFYGNQLNETFPESFGRISPLIHLDLSFNNIGGPLPNLDVFPFLRTLKLRENLINGVLSESIGQLLELEILDVASNLLQGKISEAHLSKLSKLQYLDLSYNSLSLDFSVDWFPSFQLNNLLLSSCNLGPKFPNWLYNQKNISVIDISRTGISDTVPSWFWDLTFEIRELNLSQNQIRGSIPNLSSKFFYFPLVDLSSNSFSGTVPILPRNVSSLYLSMNLFSGSISSSVCGSTGLTLFILDLSDNLLSGELPDCFLKLQSLLYLNLANNQFKGELPESIGSLNDLQILNIHNNSLSGNLPFSLRNCTSLRLLDLGDNHLSGEIPHWLGESLQYLLVASFRSNQFDGMLPLTLCNLEYIQGLDLSRNNISGRIPNCINNFTALVKREAVDARIYLTYPSYIYETNFYLASVYFNVLLEWKGRQADYENTLGLVKIIDLSTNKLIGEIPDAITSLVGIIALNLSRNNLTGKIPSTIGQLRWLDFLDLSNNNLSGQIPTSITHLSNLGVLNLSNNNLSGMIPRSTQLQSYNASAYMGNLFLCGPPLTISCNHDKELTSPTLSSDNNKDRVSKSKFKDPGLYVSVVLGFFFGFCGFVGPLFLNNKWIYAYSQHLDVIVDRIYVTVALRIARLQ